MIVNSPSTRNFKQLLNSLHLPLRHLTLEQKRLIKIQLQILVCHITHIHTHTHTHTHIYIMISGVMTDIKKVDSL